MIKIPRKLLSQEISDVIHDEVNIKLKFKTVSGGKEIEVELNTKITPELKAGGDARDLIRKVQMLRKEKGCKINEQVSLILTSEYKDLTKELLDEVKRETLSDTISWGDALTISIG